MDPCSQSCYHSVRVHQFPLWNLVSLPLFILLSFLASTLCPQTLLQIPVYKPHTVYPGLGCETCLSEPTGVRQGKTAILE